MAQNLNPYALTTIQTPKLTGVHTLTYAASCGHTGRSVQFVASPATTTRIAAALAQRPCSACLEALPIVPANRSGWRVVGR